MSSNGPVSSLEERLVWIVGSPRSGSTWLLRLLLHPWGLGQTETGIDRSRFRPAGPDLVPINESYLPNHLGPLREPSEPSAEAAARRMLLNDQRAGDPSYFFSDAYRKVWIDGARRMALDRFGAQVDRAQAQLGMSQPLVMIKEPNGSHAADLIAEMLPRCRMIFLLRDGRDVIDSMLEADSPGGWRTRTEGVKVLQGEEDRIAAVRRQAYLWLARTEAVERACAALGSERWIRVRYEDLLADTEEELARIDAWLAIARSTRGVRRSVRANRFGSLRNRIRGKQKGLRAASPGLWRENMSETEQAAMAELIEPKLVELGYAPSSASGSRA